MANNNNTTDTIINNINYITIIRPLTNEEKDEKINELIERIHNYGNMHLKNLEDNLYNMNFFINSYELIETIIQSMSPIMAENITYYSDILYEINYNGNNPYNINLIVEEFRIFHLRRFLEGEGFSRIQILFNLKEDLTKETNI
jgi:hypothetical protein